MDKRNRNLPEDRKGVYSCSSTRSASFIYTLCDSRWLVLGGIFASAALAMLHLIKIEFGPLRDHVLQIDELYFASCAARSIAMGEFPISGCHDSKGPVVFLLYQIVQGGATYNLFSIKVAAFSTVVLISGLVAYIALRLSGIVAAVVSSVLVLQTFSLSSSLMAFKTDTIGTALMLGGLVLLTGFRPSKSTFFAGGLLFGFAVVTKQTFAFVAVAVLIWMAISMRDLAIAQRRAFIKCGTTFIIGVLAPFSIFLLIFFLKNEHIEFLASFFLYPSLYAPPPGELSLLKSLFLRIGQIFDTFHKSTFLTILFATGAVISLRIGRPSEQYSELKVDPYLLIFVVAVSLVGVLVISPFYFEYHTTPAMATMAIFSGMMVGDLWDRARDLLKFRIAIAVSLLISTILAAMSSWLSNGGRGDLATQRVNESVINNQANAYGYVLGTRPSFYVHNKLIPASDVMFPWALTGTPANWFYTPPSTDSLKGRILGYVQKRTLPKLFDDFKRTPPHYILVVNNMARASTSLGITDVPGFDEYLRDKCVFQRTIADERGESASLYSCYAE
jgi:hypothetical protein